MSHVLELLVGDPPPAPRGAEGWWAQHQALAARFPRSVDLALAGGFSSDRLAWAFLHGYQAACALAIPEAEGPTALCVTEAGGGHPRAIQTELRDGALFGEKTFVTQGRQLKSFTVIAREGYDAQGRPRLRSAIVSAASEGVELIDLPSTPFAPELSHCALRLSGAVPALVLDNDGYVELLKPFRTVEDLRVGAAVAGLHIRIAVASGWPHALREAWLAFAATLRGLDDADPKHPATHLALAGALARSSQLQEDSALHWALCAPDVAERMQRDAPLMGLARRVQRSRRERARELWAE